MNRSESLDEITLRLVRGIKPETIEEQHAELGLSLADVKSLILDAKDRITLAADYNRIEEIGRAYLRLNDLFKLASEERDPKVALAAQKELNRLLRLYEKPDASEKQGEAISLAEQELAAIDKYLRPLNVAPSDYPLSGVARIVADLVRRGGGVESAG